MSVGRGPGVRDSAEGLVRRQRLFGALERGTKRALTLVSGPAGSGKTLLVTSWLQEGFSPIQAAWVPVKRGEQDATRFWTAVGVALHASGALAAAPAPPATGVLDEFVDQLGDGLRELADPVLLVIDDLDRLETQAGLDGLAALLDRRIAQLRMLIITRRIPQLGLHRLRVRGDLTEIRGADLALTVRETDALLTTAGVDLSEERVALLQGRTEGWAAGLRLAALALVGHADPDRLAARFSGSDRTVAEYLNGEVLAGLPPAVRRLLLRTSVLQRVNGPLADVLTGRSEGERTLQELEDANAFVVSLDARHSWFRYHHLLADVLRMELRRDSPGEIRGLHQAAAQWHAAHGSPLEAVRHAVAAGDWEYAATLLVQHWFDLVLDGQRRELAQHLAAFPTEQLRAVPELALLAADDRLAAGRLEAADAYLTLAERLAASDREPLAPRFEVVLAVVKLERAHVRGDLDAAVEAANAILAPAKDERLIDFVSDDALRAFALMHLGFVELWSWQLEAADAHLREGRALAERGGRPYVTLGCLGAWAELANMRMQLDLAEHRARTAIELAQQLGWLDASIVGGAYAALGGSLLGRGRLDQSASWLERAAQVMQGRHDPETSVLLPFSRGALQFAQGRYESARESLREAELAYTNLRVPARLATSAKTWQLRARVRLGDIAPARAALAEAGAAGRATIEWCNLAAHIHLAEGDPESAAEALAPALDGSAIGFHAVLELEALLLEAVARDRLGQPEAAAAALERVLERAESAGQVWIVLSVPSVRPLLERYPRHRTAHAAFIADLLDHFAGSETTSVADDVIPLAEALSARERDVLGFLPTNLTAAEIAGELEISVHTVKTHMRSVYAKLGVHRRADAVKRARALGLLARSRRGR